MSAVVAVSSTGLALPWFGCHHEIFDKSKLVTACVVGDWRIEEQPWSRIKEVPLCHQMAKQIIWHIRTINKCSHFCFHSDMSESREATGDNVVVREVPDKAASSFHIWKPNRTVIVEPIALLIGLCVLPTGMLSQFYIVAYYTEQLSNGTIVNSSHHNGNHRSESLCDVNKSDPVFVFGEEVQRRATNFSLILGLCSLIPALFVTMFIGAYSDKAGRRYAIIPPIAGCTLRAISYIVVIGFKLPVEYLVIGAVMEGFGGYYHTLLLGCFAYISDIVPADRRSLRITILETCFIIPAVFTPLGFGYWVKHGGFLAPFLAVLALCVIILVYAIFFVPETVLGNSEAKLFSTKHIKNTMLLFTKDDDTRRRWKLCVLLCAVFVCGVAKMGYCVDTLFEMNSPLCWTSDIIGYFLSAKVAVVAAGAVLSMRLLKCCMQDGGIALTSCLMGVVRSAYTAFVQNSAMMYISKCNITYYNSTFTNMQSGRRIFIYHIRHNGKCTLIPVSLACETCVWLLLWNCPSL